MKYDFKCPCCEHTEEVVIPACEYDDFKENNKCPECGEKMERVWTPIGGTEYKCDGFYDTDYRGVSSR